MLTLAQVLLAHSTTTSSRWLGAIALVVIGLAGVWLIACGVWAGIRRRRIPMLHRSGKFYEGTSAIAEGAFRVVVGTLLLGFIAWMLCG